MDLGNCQLLITMITTVMVSLHYDMALSHITGEYYCKLNTTVEPSITS